MTYRKPRARVWTLSLPPLPTTPACWRWKPPPEDAIDRIRERIARERREDRGEDHGLPEPAEDSLRWMLMCEWQNDRCAICGGNHSRRQNLVRDHDHETGLIRGLLCRSCNTLEGLDCYATEGIYGKYHERNPASICGVREEYFGGWGCG